MKCKFVKYKGERCKLLAFAKEDFCVYHSRSEKAKQARAKMYRIKKSKEAITTVSSSAINRLELTTVRWGQDGWILDYLNEDIFKRFMKDFHKELKEDGRKVLHISPATLFHFYIDGMKHGGLPAPMAHIDLRKAKNFTGRALSEKQLSKIIKKVGNQIFKGGIILPEIVNLDTQETFAWCLPQDDTIFSYALCEKEKMGEKPRGLKTVKHCDYHLMLTFMGIYMILTASAFYNIEFIPKALYKLNHACNDFFRSIAGWQRLGHQRLSYIVVRERMGIRDKANPSTERERIKQNLNYLKDNHIIEDWKIVKGDEKYGKNENIMYDIIFSKKTCERRKNFAIRKAIQKQQEERIKRRTDEINDLWKRKKTKEIEQEKEAKNEDEN